MRVLIVAFSSFIFLILMSSSCSSQAIFDVNKQHHDKNNFKTNVTASMLNWFKMMSKEGLYPEIDPDEIESIQQKADLAKLNLDSQIPRATWIGHATVLVQYAGINFLTDPHLTKAASPIGIFGPKRMIPPALRFDELPKIDFIVISHNHYDHLDHRTVDMFGSSVNWFVPLGLKKWFVDRGISPDKVMELDWWESNQFAEDVKITFTPNIHWSKRTPWDTNKSLWGSWIIEINGFKTWFAGDTGYDNKMFKEIGEKAGPFDLALIPIGAYSPRYFMSSQHIDPVEAVLVHQDIQSRKSIPIHWATFQLSHEPLLEPSHLLFEAVSKSGLPIEIFKAINIGQTVEIKLKENK